MKSIKKYLFIMAALAAVFGFVACGDEDDNPSTVAEYKATYSSYTLLVTFLDDGTWSQTSEYLGKNKTTMAEGTYRGNPSADGKVYITPTKYLNNDNKLTEIPKEYQEEETLNISNKKFTYDYTTYTRQ